MKALIVDNYDSFTFNLYQYLGELGAAPVVVQNDALDLAGLRALRPTHIVISPGPGSPDRSRDFGISAAVITELAREVPVLGVCLGHQGIIHHLGGQVIRAPEVVHGKTSWVRCEDCVLFRGLPAEIEVMRYHSLLGDAASLPPSLRIIARTVKDALIMGVEHDTWPLWGIQFHPESIGTPSGKQILANFLSTSPGARTVEPKRS